MSVHPTIRPRPGILDIEIYKPGAASVAGANRVVKLSANENPHGPSPKAIEAYAAQAHRLAVYPDGGSTALRSAIAEVHGVEADRVVCGAGSDEIIMMLIKGYVNEGDEVLYPEHGFTMFRLYTLGASGTPVAAPETDLTTDVDALIARLTDRTRLVFVANPNNPTGTMIGRAGLERLADAMPAGAMLVIDGAYAEYLAPEEDDGAIEIARGRDNVVVTRTFSKIHGLAALRLGWGYMPGHVAAVLNRIRGPFNTTAPALAAGEAAVRDQAYVEHCRVTNEVWRAWLTKEIRAAGYEVTPSFGNFVLVHTGDDTAKVDGALKARGLIVRGVGEYGLHRHLRITVGDEAACRDVAATIRAAGPGR